MKAPRKWIVIDCPYLCWRAFHSTGSLEFEGVRTGVLYGFFKTVKALQITLGTRRIVFCFDLGPGLRNRLCSTYKSNRRKADDDRHEEARSEVRRQIDLLRTDYLERIGYRNVFFQKGYEADDIIASVVKNSLPEDAKAMIVSADKDLYQLLTANVSIWNPRAHSQKANGRFTRKAFKETFNGLTPEQWVEVKAIAGCPSDNVPGVRGVGETSAAAYLCNRPVNQSSKRLIDEWTRTPQYKTNLKLVSLPYEGCKTFKLSKDEFNEDAWDDLMKELGMSSLRKRDF